MKHGQVPILPRIVSPASPGMARSDIILTSKEELLSSLSTSWRRRGGGCSSQGSVCLLPEAETLIDLFRGSLAGPLWLLVVGVDKLEHQSIIS